MIDLFLHLVEANLKKWKKIVAAEEEKVARLLNEEQETFQVGKN